MMMVRLGVVLLLVIEALPTQSQEVRVAINQQISGDFDLVDHRTTASVQPTQLKVDDAAGVSLVYDQVYNREADGRVGLYLSHGRARLKQEGQEASHIGITHLHFTGTRYYPSGSWAPYVLAGLGLARFDPDRPELRAETQFAGQLGVGLSYAMGNWRLTSELRWLTTFFNNSGRLFCAGGCELEIRSNALSQVHVGLGLGYHF